MNRLCIVSVLEKMNALERTRIKYDNRSEDYYCKGDLDHSNKWDHRADLVSREIQGMEFTLHKLGLSVWKTRDNEWVIPEDDIVRAT